MKAGTQCTAPRVFAQLPIATAPPRRSDMGYRLRGNDLNWSRVVYVSHLAWSSPDRVSNL